MARMTGPDCAVMCNLVNTEPVSKHQVQAGLWKMSKQEPNVSRETKVSGARTGTGKMYSSYSADHE